MAESVDALVSNTSGATRAGSTPALGTKKPLNLSIRRFFFFLWELGFLLYNFPETAFVRTDTTEILTTHGFDIAVNRSFTDSDIICQVSS